MLKFQGVYDMSIHYQFMLHWVFFFSPGALDSFFGVPKNERETVPKGEKPDSSTGTPNYHFAIS